MLQIQPTHKSIHRITLLLLSNQPLLLLLFPLPPTPSFTPSSTPILINQICSPLQGETLSTLSKIITQPFIMPPLGFDYDHQGVDFSYYRRNGRIGIQGLPVYASLEGKVISVLRQKQVYGNAIIIETQVDQMQAGWLSNLASS